MKPVLVKKAYLPTIDEARGVSLDDIQALRWIPGKYRSSFSQATPFRTYGNIKWEKDKEEDLGEAYRPIPGFREGTNFQGYFMNPATAYGALQGDVGWNYPAIRAVNPILLGITNTPHFWRTPKQGASMQGYAGEGYHYGTLPKASFVEIPHETSPVDMQRAMMDFQRNRVLQGMSSDEAWDTMAEKNPDEYDVAGLFPRKITETIWGEPAQLAGNPIVDFDTARYKVASEPMDIAFQLLKQSLELQPPMTQGVEEEQPIEEEIPMIDMQTIENNDPCACAETVRTKILSDYQKYLYQIIEDEDENGPNWTFGEENDPEYETPHKHEALEYMESLIEEVENASCEEIMEHELYDEMCDNAGFSEADQMKYAGEPMDIALQLLKEDIDYQDEEYIHPHEQIWNDEADEQLLDTTKSLWDYVENMSNEDKMEWLRLQGNPFMQRGMQRMYGDYPELSQQDIDNSIWEMMFDAWQDSQMEMPGGIDFDLGGNRKSGEPGDPVRAYAVHPSQWKKLASEPMNIAFQLLKERVSPEAKRHKLEYDKKYESSPERVKYREELNRERRRRGIYGSHDHKDISHTEGGKLTLEGEHENRARHFKDKGTLREL